MSKKFLFIIGIFVSLSLFGEKYYLLKEAPQPVPMITVRETDAGIGIGVIPEDKILRIEKAPGTTIGGSQYDRQWNMNPKRRIIYNPKNKTIHTVWMGQILPAERHMRYNYWDGGGWAFGTGIRGGKDVQTRVRDGFGVLDIMNDGRAVVAFHKLIGPQNRRSSVGVDETEGMGSFSVVDLPPSLEGAPVCYLWPRIGVDKDNNMVVIARTDTLVERLYMSRSTDEGRTWSEWKKVVELEGRGGGGYDIFASKKSNKMCIIYPQHVEDVLGRDNEHPVYIESKDGGATWGAPVDIYKNAIPDPAGRLYRMYNLKHSQQDYYGMYDAEDNIHIVANATWATRRLGSYYTLLASRILHYSSETKSLNVIAEFPTPDFIRWTPSTGGDLGGFYFLHGPQIGTDAVIGEDPTTKYLYVIWISFPHDTAFHYKDVDYAVGEIYASYSLDRGKSWAPKINLTMTPQDCEVFATLSPVLNDTLHILYMWDLNSHDRVARTPAGEPQPWLDSLPAPFLYWKVPTTRGDVGVVAIKAPPAPESLIIEGSYTPTVTYKNFGTTTIDFQARFEITYLTGTIDTAEGVSDTFLFPELIYYDIINVENLAPGAETQVKFKTWIPDSRVVLAPTWWYTATGSFLVDTDITNNKRVRAFGVEEEKKPSTVFQTEIYPNPAYGIVNIKYSIPRLTNVSIKIYDIAGNLISTLIDNQPHKEGSYTIKWDTKEVPSGIYFYRIETGSSYITKKISIVK